jgi:hypothetical protein
MLAASPVLTNEHHDETRGRAGSRRDLAPKIGTPFSSRDGRPQEERHAVDVYSGRVNGVRASSRATAMPASEHFDVSVGLRPRTTI